MLKESSFDYTRSLIDEREKSQRLKYSNITICNDDLLYLVDHCYNRIGDERLKNVCDRLLLSALSITTHRSL